MSGLASSFITNPSGKSPPWRGPRTARGAPRHEGRGGLLSSSRHESPRHGPVTHPVRLSSDTPPGRGLLGAVHGDRRCSTTCRTSDDTTDPPPSDVGPVWHESSDSPRRVLDVPRPPNKIREKRTLGTGLDPAPRARVFPRSRSKRLRPRVIRNLRRSVPCIEPRPFVPETQP